MHRVKECFHIIGWWVVSYFIGSANIKLFQVIVKIINRSSDLFCLNLAWGAGLIPQENIFEQNIKNIIEI